MEKSEKVSEPERRDWGIIFVILLIGFLCVIVAGQWALRFSPSWELDTNMGSNIDPNSDFLTRKPEGFIEAVDPGILTQPAWMGLFLTPGAEFSTGTPLPPLPPATSTIPGTIAVPATFTPVTASPTNTLVWIPLPPTSTKKPKDPPTNTPLPVIDLEISMNDGGVGYTPGGTITYTVMVLNNSASNVTGATVSDVFGAQITGASWTCTPSVPAAICHDSAAPDFADMIDIPAGESVIYSVVADVSPYAAGTLPNTVTVTVAFETDPGDNQAMTSTPGPGGAGGQVTIGAGDGIPPYLIPGSGSPPLIMIISPPVSHSFVYYERYADFPTNTRIDLDMVQIEISDDGMNWYTVFYWGDGNPGNNGSIGAGYCPGTEDDNCTILAADLYPYPGTGIVIDIDSLGYTGTYPWVRITCPPWGSGPAPGESNDGCDIDAIEP